MVKTSIIWWTFRFFNCPFSTNNLQQFNPVVNGTTDIELLVASNISGQIIPDQPAEGHPLTWWCKAKEIQPQIPLIQVFGIIVIIGLFASNICLVYIRSCTYLMNDGFCKAKLVDTCRQIVFVDICFLLSCVSCLHTCHDAPICTQVVSSSHTKPSSHNG